MPPFIDIDFKHVLEELQMPYYIVQYFLRPNRLLSLLSLVASLLLLHIAFLLSYSVLFDFQEYLLGLNFKKQKKTRKSTCQCMLRLPQGTHVK